MVRWKPIYFEVYYSILDDVTVFICVYSMLNKFEYNHVLIYGHTLERCCLIRPFFTWPIPGTVNHFLISGKKIHFFIGSHKYLSVCYPVPGKYFQNKSCGVFLSVYKWAYDLNQKCHKRDPKFAPKCHKRDQAKYCIKRNSDYRISYEV